MSGRHSSNGFAVVKSSWDGGLSTDPHANGPVCEMTTRASAGKSEPVAAAAWCFAKLALGIKACVKSGYRKRPFRLHSWKSGDIPIILFKTNHCRTCNDEFSIEQSGNTACLMSSTCLFCFSHLHHAFI